MKSLEKVKKYMLDQGVPEENVENAITDLKQRIDTEEIIDFDLVLQEIIKKWQSSHS